jgi:tRNA U34 5-methylaminomethyl-2-thiouridine-forming methyltransferase MnmC
MQTKKNLIFWIFVLGLDITHFLLFIICLQNNLDVKLNFYSPELDGNLVNSLETFEFPKEFENIKHIINSVAKTYKYEDEKIKIEVFIGDARDYIKSLKPNSFDIIYQDAFSSDVNFELWTKEYFDDIYKLCKNDSIMSSYAIATPIRLSMYEAGFFIYENRPVKRKITLAFKQKQDLIEKYIDMELKKQRNKEAVALHDK